MRLVLQGRGHPPALLFVPVVLLLLAGSYGPAGASAAPTPSLGDALASPAAAGKVAFRMDTLVADLKGHAVRGLGHVVVRQDLWLLCCDQFEAQADAAGAWQSMRCTGRVRGYYDGRNLWADRADFSPAAHALTLTGRPRITQGPSHLEGTKMTVRTDTEHVHVVGPRGAMVTEPAGAPGPTSPAPNFLTGPLPATCPWPWVP